MGETGHHKKKKAAEPRIAVEKGRGGKSENSHKIIVSCGGYSRTVLICDTNKSWGEGGVEGKFLQNVGCQGTVYSHRALTCHSVVLIKSVM